MLNHYYTKIEDGLYLLASFDIDKNNNQDIWNKTFYFYFSKEPYGIDGLTAFFSRKTIDVFSKQLFLKWKKQEILEKIEKQNLQIGKICKGKITIY